MITYHTASDNPTAFHSLFGCSVAEFEELYADFAPAYEQRRTQAEITRKHRTPRKRKLGAGPRFKHDLRNRLLLTLFWLHVYPTLELLGNFFALDKTSAEDNLKDVLATLLTLSSFERDPPDRHRRKLHTLEQVLSAFPEAALVTEIEEQTRKRPRNRKASPRRDQQGSEGADIPEEEQDITPFPVSRMRSEYRDDSLLPHNLLYRDSPAFDNGMFHLAMKIINRHN